MSVRTALTSPGKTLNRSVSSLLVAVIEETLVGIQEVRLVKESPL